MGYETEYTWDSDMRDAEKYGICAHDGKYDKIDFN